MLPFTREQFLDLMSGYNSSVWPVEPFAYAVGIVALLALLRDVDRLHRVAIAMIGVMWLWTGIAYHWLFFSEINPAAIVFGLLFVIQGAGFVLMAVTGSLGFRFSRRSGAAAVLGWVLIACAFFLYPTVELLVGRWPHMPRFGISPCPVTLFTLGFLLLARPRPTLWLWAIPVAWSLIGGTAAFLLGIVQDWVLLFAGPAAVLAAFGPWAARSEQAVYAG